MDHVDMAIVGRKKLAANFDASVLEEISRPPATSEQTCRKASTVSEGNETVWRTPNPKRIKDARKKN